MDLNDNQTLTEIANSALVGIGHTVISDISDDNSAAASTVRLLLDQAIREVQSYYLNPWDELKREDVLTLRQIADYDNEGLTKEYNLPLNCMSVDCVVDAYGVEHPWRLSGGSIWTDTLKASIRYTRLSKEPDEWSAELKTAIIDLLSAKLIAGALKEFTQSEKAKQNFWTNTLPMLASWKLSKSSQGRKGFDGRYSKFYPNGAEE